MIDRVKGETKESTNVLSVTVGGESLVSEIHAVEGSLVSGLKNGKKLFFVGNDVAAVASQHLSGEIVS